MLLRENTTNTYQQLSQLWLVGFQNQLWMVHIPLLDVGRVALCEVYWILFVVVVVILLVCNCKRGFVVENHTWVCSHRNLVFLKTFKQTSLHFLQFLSYYLSILVNLSFLCCKWDQFLNKDFLTKNRQCVGHIDAKVGVKLFDIITSKVG